MKVPFYEGSNICDWFDIIKTYPNKPWNWDYLSNNRFYKAKYQFIVRKYREYMSAYRIQQCWNRAISIPTNPICQRRIERDYEKCTGRSFC